MLSWLLLAMTTAPKEPNKIALTFKARFIPAGPPPSGLPGGLGPQPVYRQADNAAIDLQVLFPEAGRICRSEIGFDRRQLRIGLP